MTTTQIFDGLLKRNQMTNADKIRAMSNEELAVSIMCPAEYDLSFKKDCNASMDKNCRKCCLEWLQKEVEE